VTEDTETSTWRPAEDRPMMDGVSSPPAVASVQQRAAQIANERPEAAAAAAFAGGFLLAMILKRLAR
jgi:hypothetical protein